MKLSELLKHTTDNQEILLYGDGIRTSIEADAETLINVLSEHVQGMKVTEFVAEGNFLKVWIEEASDGK